MKQEFDELLCSRYPDIYRDRRESTYGQPVQVWGFDVADGWLTLIDTLSAEIQKHIDQTPGCDEVLASDVKEKHDTLSFNVSGGDAYIDGLVWMAELLSARICQICGTIDCGAHRCAGGRSGRGCLRVPAVRNPAWGALAETLDYAIDHMIRCNGTPEVAIEAVHEGDSLRFSWQGGNDEVSGFFGLVEALSRRLA